jgi:hypothetical protein
MPFPNTLLRAQIKTLGLRILRLRVLRFYPPGCCTISYLFPVDLQWPPEGGHQGHDNSTYQRRTVILWT